MNVSKEVINTLVENDIDTMFGIPGKQSLPLNESISQRDDIRFVMARHETAVSHQAWGYATSSGGIAATVVIPGPGDMNAMNGLKNALNDCVPLLHIAVETAPEIRGGDGIHETPPDTYDNVVKDNILVETPQSVIAELQRAIEIAMTAPTGPVRIGIPKNFLKMDVELATRSETIDEPEQTVPELKVEAAADLLADASAPIIFAGGGVRAADATDELRRVAERLDAPVATTYKGKGVFPDDHNLSTGAFCGGAGTDMKRLVSESDVALGIGTDFDAVSMQGWSVEVPERLVHVTLDADDIGTGYDPAVGIVADAGNFLSTLDDTLSQRSISSDGSAARAQATRDAMNDRVAELRETDEAPLPSVAALDAIREAVPRDATISLDAGGFRLWALMTFPIYDARDIVTPGSWASMGTGLPGAIGAKAADPDETVVAITGDGGLLMCIHELHTLADEEFDVAVVALNNGDYAIISEEASRSYHMEDGKYGWQRTPVSYTKVAEGLGIDAVRAESTAEIEAAVGKAIKTDGPVFVEILTDPYEPQASVLMND